MIFRLPLFNATPCPVTLPQFFCRADTSHLSLNLKLSLFLLKAPVRVFLVVVDVVAVVAVVDAVVVVADAVDAVPLLPFLLTVLNKLKANLVSLSVVVVVVAVDADAEAVDAAVEVVVLLPQAPSLLRVLLRALLADVGVVAVDVAVAVAGVVAEAVVDVVAKVKPPLLPLLNNCKHLYRLCVRDALTHCNFKYSVAPPPQLNVRRRDTPSIAKRSLFSRLKRSAREHYKCRV